VGSVALLSSLTVSDLVVTVSQADLARRQIKNDRCQTGGVMRFRTAIVLTSILAFQFTPTTSAHHSFAGEFDNSVAVTLHGVVTSIEMINPHSFIYLDVRSGDGVERWALEGPGPLQVRRRGLDLTFIKVGEELGTCGYLAKRDVVPTRAEPGAGRPARKLQAAVLIMPGGEKLVWNNYRQEKCGLDR
jgi:hypothetical protein